MSPYERAEHTPRCVPGMRARESGQAQAADAVKGEWRAVKKRGVGNPKTVGFCS